VRAATEEEAAAYKKQLQEAVRAREEAELSQRLQLRVVAEEDFRALRTAVRELRKPKGES
jgi:hypothetical protein